MTIDSIVQALRQEKERIENALAALGDKGGNGKKGPRVSAGGGWSSSAGGEVGNGGGRKRRMSTAARRKISEAAKARWAKAKKSGRNRL